jgi:linoleoyl-CoA desaturase
MIGYVTAPLDIARVRFRARGAFARDLETEVDAYFADHGRSRRDAPRMYLKTAIILAWFIGSWVVLVFVAAAWWQGVLAAVSLGLSVAAVGMSVQHDANHGATSSRRWVNRLFGATLDVMGVCSFIWRPKHNVFHHTFTNVVGVDYDLDFGALARLSPEQPRRPWHRWQHVYLWGLYGFLLPKWVFYDDWFIVKHKVIGRHALPTPSRGAMVGFFAWKLFFLAWAVIVPAIFHPILDVVLFHVIAAFTLGATLGTVFQLAHCTGEAEFPAAPPGGLMATDWAEHQLATCVDFAGDSRALSWFMGGLNFQVEHHLFPKVCHVHYPALARIVTDVAAKHGLARRSHGTLRQAMASHFLHLRALGKIPAPELAASP